MCGAGLVPARVLLATVARRLLFLSSLGHRHVAVLARPPGLKEFELALWPWAQRIPSRGPAPAAARTHPRGRRRPPFVRRCNSPPSPARLLGSACPALALEFAGPCAPGGGGGLASSAGKWPVALRCCEGDSGLEVGQVSCGLREVGVER